VQILIFSTMTQIRILIPFFSLLFFSVSSFAQTNASDFYSEDDSIKHFELKGVDVYGKQIHRRNNVYRYSPLMSRPLISISGETDVIRYIGTLPGVSQGMEGGSGYFVRGSNSGNNRLELDGVPVYGGTHLFGLFSVFPQGIIEDVDYRSGRFPANSGNYLASLARISTDHPLEKEYHGSMELSPLMVGGSLRGFLSDRFSVVASGRISLLGTEYRLAKAMASLEEDVKITVGDAFLKLNYQLNGKHRFSASGYFSNDYFNFESDAMVTMNWGNQLMRFSWDWNVSENTRLQTMVYGNYYHSGQEQKDYNEDILTGELKLHSSLSEMAAQTRIINRGDRISYEAGIKYNAQLLKPRSEKILVQKDNFNTRDDSFETIIISGFSEASWRFNWLELAGGLRSYFYRLKEDELFEFDFRGAVSAHLSDKSGIEFSFDQLTQFHHILESLPVGWSLDVMIPSTHGFSPEKANQFYLGGFGKYKNWIFSGGTYYKKMNNLVRYKNPSTVLGGQNSDWYSDVVTGDGYSYGLEVRGERKGEHWDGSFSYTFSKSDRTFAEINDGESFPFRFDRRHMFNINASITTKSANTKNQFLNTAFSMTSGNRVTIPVAMYKGVEPPYWSQRDRGLYVSPRKMENALYRQKIGEENGYLLPSYVRFDVGYTFQKKKEKYTRSLTVGLYNVLNRQNPYLVFHEDGRWQQLSIFPLFPSVKWLLEF